MLWLVVLSAPKSTEGEGFQISLGDNADAGGIGYVDIPSRGSSNNVSTGTTTKTIKTVQPTQPTQPTAATKQTVFTQSDNSVALNEQKEKERVTKAQTEINNQRIETERRKAEQSK